MRAEFLSLSVALGDNVVMASGQTGHGASPSVAIFGGGVGGLSVAQELLERGFKVTVYEKSHFGGKVRGMPVPGSGTDGRKDLPGQHGFHFFPGFYKNLPDTMKRIPSLAGKTVFEHIVWGKDELVARENDPSAVLPAGLTLSVEWIVETLKGLVALKHGISFADLTFFAVRTLAYMATCAERRVAELDEVTWWDYVGASGKSEEYQRLIATMPSSLLVAVLPRVASTRTLGNAMIQMLQVGFRLGTTIDRLLDGPEEEVWVQPWVAHIHNLGGELRMPAELIELDCDGARITGATILEGGVRKRVESDFYVCALPVDRAVKVLSPTIRRAAPSLMRIDELRTGWMNGVQLFLSRQVPLVRGHVAFDDTPWAITSVSQAQFWPDFDWSKYGNGQSREAFSIIISNWDAPGVVVCKPAKLCSQQEIYTEVMAQMNASLAKLGEAILPSDVVCWFIDPDIVFPRGEAEADRNQEKLYITTCGAWTSRPGPTTEIPNLFLAADWLQTDLDFASAEGTNQVSRQAANAILDAAGSKARRSHVYRTKQPLLTAPLRALDAVMFRLGLPALGYWGCTPLTPPPRIR